jgi:hypothetical protein
MVPLDSAVAQQDALSPVNQTLRGERLTVESIRRADRRGFVERHFFRAQFPFLKLLVTRAKSRRRRLSQRGPPPKPKDLR